MTVPAMVRRSFDSSPGIEQTPLTPSVEYDSPI